jgi:electron transport complex protein RnfG
MPVNAIINKYLVITLTVLILVCVLLLTITHKLTRDRIADNRQLATRRVIQDLVPPGSTNDIFEDTLQVTEPGYLGTTQPVTVYRARTGEDITGVIFYPVVAQGYENLIELTVGISKAGNITGVRVIREDETDGLGDQVNQRNSDWILTFNGTSFDAVPREQWAVSSEEGHFDGISGATITSRSVINAVRDTLDYHELAAESLYR